MKKILILTVLFLILVSGGIFASETTSEEAATVTVSADNAHWALMAKYFAAGLAISVACVSAGLAIGRIGSAAMGAISERPEAAGSAMILAALAEGVCLWGFLIAFFILGS